MTFKQLGLNEAILKALVDKGYETPSPIQAQSIPILLENKDLLGVAQTGTGKTAAFAIPIIEQLLNDTSNENGKRKIKALVVTPTRELAIQIADNFVEYTKYARNISTTVIFGGVKQGKQTARLAKGVDVLVATPGRLLDLINQRFISLSDVKHIVLDEADHMLDMGFIHDVRKIIKLLPAQRQSLLFSATMPKDIVEISKSLLGNKFERVTIKPQQATAERVEQAVYMVTKKNKGALLQDILNEKGQVSTLVFSRTKHGANKIVKVLVKSGFKAEAIHGNKSQASRQKSLKAFKEGKVHILVATDIAARGIDVDELALVINYDLPNIPETYVHRIGRTGRAAASGIALSFCNGEERAYLRDIQKLIKQEVPVITDHNYVDEGAEPTEKEKKEAKRLKNENRSNRGRSQGRSSRDDRNGPKKKKPNKRRNENRSERSDDRKDDRPKREDRRNQPQGERSERKNSDQKPRDGKPSNKRRNDRDGKPREERKDQKPRSSKPGDKKSSDGNPRHNNNRKKKSKDGLTKTERKFREGQKKTSDYKGRYRPKGTMWELD